LKKGKWVAVRRVSQLVFSLSFIILLWRAIYPIQGINGAKIFFAFNPLIAFGVSIAQRVFLSILIPASVFLLITALLGRFFCGWICPLGAMIDIAGSIRSKIINRKKEIYKPWMRLIKYLMLFIMLFLAVLGIQVIWWGDPITIAGRFISMNFIPFIVNLVDGFFRISLQITKYPEALLSMYRSVQGIIGGIRTEYFASAAGILGLWIAIILINLLSRRFWCRNLCPLGAVLSIASKLAFLKRNVSEACVNCGKCQSDCRMGAIKEDNSYRKEECILCMDCIYDCPASATYFNLGRKKSSIKNDASKRTFLKILGVSVFSAFTVAWRRRKRFLSDNNTIDGIIRPPAALKENDFINRCIRCGNCMRVCVTNGLQPVIMEAGFGGVWTPKLVPEIGHCEYLCTMCSKVCPTGAIKRVEVEEKKITRLGTARVSRDKCIPWQGNGQCIVCEEHCPVAEKAIKIEEVEINGKIYRSPVVNRGLCIGCGACQHSCPARPGRAITVNPSTADRS
jgi:polyferredoxin